MSWQFTVLLLMFFMVSAAVSKPLMGPTIYVQTNEHVKIGETALIPVLITHVGHMKSAIVTFDVNNDFIQAGKVTFDANSVPDKVYVPITVMKEGKFDIKARITIEAPDGERFWNNESSLVGTSSLGIFAFEGEVFFARDSGSAAAAADNSLKKTDMEYNKLLNKKEKIKSGTLRQTFSKEEEERLHDILMDAKEQLLIRYYDKYPIKPSPTSRLFNVIPSSKPQTGDTVDLEVNWPIDDSYTSFLPLDGANIVIMDNDNNNTIALGILNNGKYNFTSPKDNLSFTAKVSAKYGDDFEVHNGNNGIDNKIIEIRFKDINVFNTVLIAI
ncbi:MAG: hypothetical protein LBF71_05805 [Campylobacteraceae bacterium]|nr:hypothetical protein [Campylobacteraceae bacterium]